MPTSQSNIVVRSGATLPSQHKGRGLLCYTLAFPKGSVKLESKTSADTGKDSPYLAHTGHTIGDTDGARTQYATVFNCSLT